jgi:hypothetical protein
MAVTSGRKVKLIKNRVRKKERSKEGKKCLN